MIEVTPSVTNTWTDVDLDTHINDLPADVCGVQLLLVNNYSVLDYVIGARCNGSSVDMSGQIYRGTQSAISIGVDSSKVFEVYTSRIDRAKIYIIGYYTGDDIVFFTDPVDVSTTTTGSYVDVDVSSFTTDAVGVIGIVRNINIAYYRRFFARMKGSTDDRYDSIHDAYGCGGYFVGVDENKTFQQIIDNDDIKTYVIGYIKSGAAMFNVNATDISLTTTDSYVGLSFPEGAEAGIVHVASGAYRYEYYVRTQGQSGESYYDTGSQTYIVVGADPEGKIEHTDVDFLLTGYFLGESTPETDTLTATPGSFTLTGTKATLLKSKVLGAEPGSYVLSGQDATLGRILTLPADSGSYNVSGTSAALLRSLILSAGSGSYNVSGIDADLLRSLLLGCDPGSFVFTGQDVTFVLTTAGVFVLTADGGSFAVTGQDADLLKSAILGADPGSFSFAGTAASLLASWALAAAPGSFSLTGQAATLLSSRLLSAGSGSFEVSGSAADLLKSFLLNAGPGAYNLTGSPADMFRIYTLIAGSGSYDVTGEAAALLKSSILGAGSGSFVLTGKDANLIFDLGVTYYRLHILKSRIQDVLTMNGTIYADDNDDVEELRSAL